MKVAVKYFKPLFIKSGDYVMRKKIQNVLFISLFLINFTGPVWAYDSMLKWEAASGDVLGYRIYYGISEGSYNLSQDAGNVTEYALINFNLNEGTTYYFVVRAYNAHGESGDSNLITYTVPDAGDTTPPLIPQGVTGEVVNNGVLLTWDANSETDLSGYRVYYGTSTRNYGLPIPAADDQYPISDLMKDVTYYFAVTAVDTSGNESGYSLESINIIGGSISGSTLKWDTASGDVLGYRIYYGTVEEKYTEIVDVGNLTQYSLDNIPLTEGIIYYFVVRAYNAYGESADSNITTYMIEKKDTTAPTVNITNPVSESNYEVETSSLNLSGISSDDSGVSNVTWSNSTGDTGIAVGTTSWSVSGIGLIEGDNLITITASDEAGNTSTDTLSVRYTKPDTIAPEIVISSPTIETKFETADSKINISGSASDNQSGLSLLKWSNSMGGSGLASGTTKWTVSDLELSIGENIISIQAEDKAGNKKIQTVAVIYTPVNQDDFMLPMEVGNFSVDHNIKRIQFQNTYRDPIVIVNSFSLNASEPGVLRVSDVDSKGFNVRVQEWDYLDGKHASETAGFLVIEKGRYILQDGTILEAGSFRTNLTSSFKKVLFQKSFNVTPVVISSINSAKEIDAVSTRVRRITTSGFQHRMQEQESKYRTRESHRSERVSYIAWEPSSGKIENLQFEIGKTGDVVNHKNYKITFNQQFNKIPVFIGDMQTVDGGDTSNTRWSNKSKTSVDVKVHEEKSYDKELNHTYEVMGYMIFLN